MGHFAMWNIPRTVNNPPKTIFRLRFAKPPKVTDRKAMVRGISQSVNASIIAARAKMRCIPELEMAAPSGDQASFMRLSRDCLLSRSRSVFWKPFLPRSSSISSLIRSSVLQVLHHFGCHQYMAE
jgi:hypothetical protein